MIAAYYNISLDISIHAPRVGGDSQLMGLSPDALRFQSTPPVWGATRRVRHEVAPEAISIHAPRVGGDALLVEHLAIPPDISIHAPRVGGDVIMAMCAYALDISIHAPRVGGDSKGEEGPDGH